MKNPYFWLVVIVGIGILWQCSCPNDPEPEIESVLTHHGPSDKFEQIKINLWNNSPNLGNPVIREAVIMELDELLFDESSEGITRSFDFYTSTMQKVANEIDEEVVNGIRIWMMYNHGFIIKTPHNTIAFDLVDGYTDWQEQRSYELPDRILKFIDVLFISHEHVDHFDLSIIDRVKNHGGQVISNVDINPMNINGLSIKTYNGIHTVPTRIFEVTTVDGYKIVHTGDNDNSEALPYLVDVDVLLLYAKTNESFTTYSSVGMRNCIYKLTPTITIPGHIHEFGQEHDSRAHDNDVRALYKWSFHITNNYWIPTTLQVMAWGEYFDFFK